MMVWLPLVVLAAWVGAGVVMLRRGTAPVGTRYRRRASASMLTVGDRATVTVDVAPPTGHEPVTPPHDVALVLDRSGSMGSGPGSPMWEAIRATENFVRRCPESINIGVVAFDDEAHVVASIGTPHDEVVRALGTLAAGGGTSVDRALAVAGGLLSMRPVARQAVPRTVVLLSDGVSDRAAAVNEADRLREVASIITVGFGEADEALLVEVAGGRAGYQSVRNGQELDELFQMLASTISQAAAGGLVDEEIRSPGPFTLEGTGTLYPVDVRTERSTRVKWSIPQLDARATQLTYDLLADYPGWHAVAGPNSKTTWRLADGSTREVQAPAGPRILVLPSLLSWAWPLLNPLFWMVFGRLFYRQRTVSPQVVADPIETLAEVSVPQPLPIPEKPIYRSTVKATVVVGLGHFGEQVLCCLKHRRGDRDVAAATLPLLAIHVSDVAGRSPTSYGSTRLESDERVESHQDFRPYLESLRASGPPPTRAWIPWLRWLARGVRTTAWITDRREARLALLRQPWAVEARVCQLLDTIPDRHVVVVGDAGEPESSGLLGEVAHLLATHGASTSAVLAAGTSGQTPSDVVALSRELERFLIKRGDSVLSDRTDPPVLARRLLDRVVIAKCPADDTRLVAVSDVVWEMLAYPEVLTRLPSSVPDPGHEHASCAMVAQRGVYLPAMTLWHWVREETLARVVNGIWLSLSSTDGRFRLPPVPADVGDRWASEFWTGTSVGRRPPFSVAIAGQLASAATEQTGLLALYSRLPVDDLYRDQVVISTRERQQFTNYFEAWCRLILDDAYRRQQWGLSELATALNRLEDELGTIRERITLVGSTSDRAPATRLAVALYDDLGQIVVSFRRSVHGWVAGLSGPQVNLRVSSPGHGAVCYDIENARQRTKADVFFPNDDVEAMSRQHFDRWYQVYGRTLLDRLRFDVVRGPHQSRLLLRLQVGDRQAASSAEAASMLRAFLDRYSGEVLSWPLQAGLQARQLADAADYVRIGEAAERVYPLVSASAGHRDPYVAVALKIEQTTMARALGTEQSSWDDAPFAWPEEVHARRLSSKVRNLLQREPHPISPVGVHLLGNPAKLFALLADFASDAVSRRREDCWLRRGEREYRLGNGGEGLDPVAALTNFEHILYQGALLERDLDGQPIEPRTGVWLVEPEQAVAVLADHQMLRLARPSPLWPMWEDIIRGLALEYGSKPIPEGARG